MKLLSKKKTIQSIGHSTTVAAAAATNGTSTSTSTGNVKVISNRMEEHQIIKQQPTTTATNTMDQKINSIHINNNNNNNNHNNNNNTNNNNNNNKHNANNAFIQQLVKEKIEEGRTMVIISFKEYQNEVVWKDGDLIMIIGKLFLIQDDIDNGIDDNGINDINDDHNHKEGREELNNNKSENGLDDEESSLSLFHVKHLSKLLYKNDYYRRHCEDGEVESNPNILNKNGTIHDLEKDDCAEEIDGMEHQQQHHQTNHIQQTNQSGRGRGRGRGRDHDHTNGGYIQARIIKNANGTDVNLLQEGIRLRRQYLNRIGLGSL